MIYSVRVFLKQRRGVPMPESRAIYLGRIAEIESLMEQVAARFHSQPPSNPRWIRLGNKADRQAWRVASYTPSDRQLRYIYLCPDGRAAVVARSSTNGSKKSPYAASLLNLQSLRHTQTPDNERMTKALREGLALLQPRPPMRLPSILRSGR